MNYQLSTLLTLAFSATVLCADSPETHSKKDEPLFQQSEPLSQKQYPAAYNAPAQVLLKKNDGTRMPDMFVNASFLYYHADQDGLDIGTSSSVSGSGVDSLLSFTSNAQVAVQDFDYKPGFKVGIGARFCEWTLEGDYTWIRQTTHTDRTAPDSDLPGSIGVWALNNWFEQNSPNQQTISASAFHSKWHLAIDMADLTVARAFYQGRNLTLTPLFGLKAAWIRQTMRVGINIPTAVLPVQRAGATTSHNSSHAWSLGPEIGLQANMLMGAGFRVQGNAGTSLLYTSYTHVKHSEVVGSPSATPASLSTSYTNYNCVRPMAQLGLGLGFGTYLANQKYHIDFAATYDFMVFWNQNMMRNLLDSTITGSAASPGNLNLHGLTFTAQIDF